MDSNDGKIAGGCLCGAIRYVCTSKPVLQFNCHCRDCQRTTGSAFAPILFYDSSSLEIAGKAKFFASTGGSGNEISRGFCPECGSQLFGKIALMPNHISIRAGTLDDTTSYQPRADIYVSQASHWDHMNEQLEKYQEAATSK